MQYTDAEIKDILALSGAYLSRSDLKDTILEGINWLSYLGIIPDHRGTARAYKVTTSTGEGVYRGGVNYATGKTFSAKLDTDTGTHCGSGINLATLPWCLSVKSEGRRLFLMSFKVSPTNVCVPLGSDGKFRVAHCTKVGECDWHGNLLKGGSQWKPATFAVTKAMMCETRTITTL